MSRPVPSPTVGDQITSLLTGFLLTTAARELVSRFVEAEQQAALPLLLDVLAVPRGHLRRTAEANVA